VARILKPLWRDPAALARRKPKHRQRRERGTVLLLRSFDPGAGLISKRIGIQYRRRA
jgi:hypothetical protein